MSFNVHGIVYVPESEAPSDPLEVEGVYYVLRPTSGTAILESSHVYSGGQGSGVVGAMTWLRTMTC